MIYNISYLFFFKTVKPEYVQGTTGRIELCCIVCQDNDCILYTGYLSSSVTRTADLAKLSWVLVSSHLLDNIIYNILYNNPNVFVEKRESGKNEPKKGQNKGVSGKKCMKKRWNSVNLTHHTLFNSLKTHHFHKNRKFFGHIDKHVNSVYGLLSILMMI